MASAEVVDVRPARLGNSLERFDVGVRQVADVDVVAQTGAVWRWIVVAEHQQSSAPRGRLDRARNEVNFRRVVFANLAVRVCSRGIEIAKRDRVQAERVVEMRQRTLDGQLRLAVAVDRNLRVRLADRRLDGFAVRGARRGEHEQTRLLERHRLEHRERAGDVVPVVLRRLTHRLTDVEEGGEVHDRPDVVLAQRLPDRRQVGDVALNQRSVANGLAMPRDQVVVDHHVVAGPVEGLGGMAPDIASAACDQDAFAFSGQWTSIRTQALASDRAGRCSGRRRSLAT